MREIRRVEKIVLDVEQQVIKLRRCFEQHLVYVSTDEDEDEEDEDNNRSAQQ